MRTSSRWARFSVLAIVGLMLQLPGCWCESPRPEIFNTFPGPEPANAADFCAAWAPTECAYAERCEPAVKAGLDERDGCSTHMTRRCQQRYAPYLAAIEAGRTTYDGYLARGCLSTRGNRACDANEPEACARVFGGNVKQDQPCTLDVECADGLFCSGGPDTCGLCIDRAGKGGACWSDASCEPGYRCFEGACTPLLVAGTPCYGQESLCAPGTFCPQFPPGFPVPDELIGLITCTNVGLLGRSCDPAFGFIPVACEEGLTCLGSDGGSHCVAPGAVGDACDPMGRTAPPCEAQGVRNYCDSITKTCTAIRVVGGGEACGASAICNVAYECRNGTCEERPTTASECIGACFEAQCVEGTCIDPGVVGEACGVKCAPGLRCVDGKCGAEACDGGMAWDAGTRDIVDAGTMVP